MAHKSSCVLKQELNQTEFLNKVKFKPIVYRWLLRALFAFYISS